MQHQVRADDKHHADGKPEQYERDLREGAVSPGGGKVGGQPIRDEKYPGQGGGVMYETQKQKSDKTYTYIFRVGARCPSPNYSGSRG